MYGRSQALKCFSTWVTSGAVIKVNAATGVSSGCATALLQSSCSRGKQAQVLVTQRSIVSERVAGLLQATVLTHVSGIMGSSGCLPISGDGSRCQQPSHHVVPQHALRRGLVKEVCVVVQACLPLIIMLC